MFKTIKKNNKPFTQLKYLEIIHKFAIKEVNAFCF